ncbi:MAG: nucleotidyl transferase AbiEii/AbiGii toxin family protein [bacterium]
MLNYEILIQQAKLRGLPLNKVRAILREYLQTQTLKILNNYHHNELYFTGGTFLRLVFQNKRFSEDLDFYYHQMNKVGFENLMEKTAIELKRYGFNTEVNYTHWDNNFVGKLIFKEIENKYGVVSEYSKKSGIMIKVEASKYYERAECKSHIISGFGEIFPCLCADKSVLFSYKIDAISKKHRGRDIYDLIFCLVNKFIPDKDVLSILDKKNEPLEFILESISKIPSEQLSRQAKILQPFLFDESEIKLIENAHTVIPELIENYQR